MGSQRGYSYLWLLFVVALMALGMAVATQVHVTASQRDKERELIAIGRQFRSAIASYYEGPSDLRLGVVTAPVVPGERDYSRYPSTLADLLRDPRFPNVRRHLRKVFVDPMTGRSDWGLVMRDGRLIGVHSLSKRRPIRQAGFEPDNAHFENTRSYSEWVFSYPSEEAARP